MAVTTPVNSGYTIINGTTTGSNGSKVNTWVEYKVTAQSVANNTSTIRVVLYSQATWDSGTVHNTTKQYGYVKIDNNQQSYTMTGGYDFGNMKLNKFADYTFTVTHGTDGKKTVSISGSWSDTWSTYISGGSASASVTLPQIARASTVSSFSGTLGSSGSITITRQDSSFTHTLQYSFDNSNWTNIATGVGASYSWTPGVSLISNFSNQKTKTGYLRCITYSGSSQVGTSTSTLTLTVPNSYTANVNGTYGTALNLNIYNSCESGLTYTFQYYDGSAWVSIASGVTTKTVSWTPPTSLIANVNNSATGTVSIRIITYVGTATVNTATGTATLTIPKNTSSARSGTIGSALTIPINKVHSKLTSTITYSFGNQSNIQIVSKTTSTSYSWTPAASLLSEIPNATSGTGTIKIETFNGTQSLGSNSYTLTLSAASSVIPSASFESPTRVNTNATVESWGIYLQGYSAVKLKLTATGNSGSTIASMSISGQGISSSSTPGTTPASLETTSSVFSSAGTFSYIGEATDTRGRSAVRATSSNVVVQAYTSPAVSNVRIVRCNSDGTEDSAGASLKVTFSASFTQVGQNAFTAHLQYKESGGTWQTITATELDPATSNIFNLGLHAEYNYYTRIRYSDSLSGYMYSQEITVASDARIMNVNPSGSGLAIGGFSTQADTLQVYYPTDFVDDLPTISGNFFPNEMGSYGLWNQEILPTTCDLNDYKTAGNYYVNTQTGFTITNKPTECTGAFNLTVERYMNVSTKTAEAGWTGVFQTIKHYDGKIWFRNIMKNASDWSYGSWDSLSPTMGTGILSDFNNYITNGNYWIDPNTTTTNRPMNTYGVLSVFRASTNLIKQEFSAYSTGRTWVRTYTNSQWYAWKELISGTKNNTYSDVELNAPLRGDMILLNAKTYSVTGNLNDNWKDFLKAVCDDFISGSYPTGSYILNLSWQSVTWGQGMIFVNGTAYVMVKWFLPNQGYLSAQLWNGTYLYSWIPGSAANVVKDVDVTTFSKAAGSTETLASISLPAGRYIIEGYASPTATASGQKFELWLDATGNHREGIWSGANGILYMNIHHVNTFSATTTVKLNMYSSAAVTVTNIGIRATALNWT